MHEGQRTHRYMTHPLSTNTLHFISGNPQYEVKKGAIEFFEDVALDRALTCDRGGNSSPFPQRSCGSPSNTTRLLCIISVPSFMIHQELLMYLSSEMKSIVSMHVLRHYSSQDQYCVILLLDSTAACNVLLNDYHGRDLSSLQPTTCMIYPVKSIYLLKDDFSKGYFFIRGYTNFTDNEKQDEEYCSVCLELISPTLPKSFTTCCNHTFHITCISRSEGIQCPLCRFQHDSYNNKTCCTMCGWFGGENEREAEAAHPFPEVMSRTDPSGTSDRTVDSLTPNTLDLWVCLVCGFVGCGESNMNHIKHHYDLSLHAYAMNTETKRVYDFAGEGYVHRLILYKSDNGTDIPEGVNEFGSYGVGSPEGSLKVAEVYNPRSLTAVRHEFAPLSQHQEDSVVSRKLESVAEHYSGALAWQLEQQREHYECLLSHLRSYNVEDRRVTSSEEENNYSRTWTQKVLQLLAREKEKLLKQREAALLRLRNAEEEKKVLLEFNSNLLLNKDMWAAKADHVSKCLHEAERSYRNSIPPLEKRVRSLEEQISSL